jgi:hypothetical protein
MKEEGEQRIYTRPQEDPKAEIREASKRDTQQFVEGEKQDLVEGSRTLE